MLGAAGGIGQPLSLLLKANPLIGELSLYDVANTPGVAADLSHISTGAVVKGYLGPAQLDACLHGCQLVFIPAGALPLSPAACTCMYLPCISALHVDMHQISPCRGAAQAWHDA